MLSTCCYYYPGRRELDGRLTSAQTAMLLQEESIKRCEREKCQLVERIGNIERSLTAAENDKQLLQVQRRAGKI